MGLAKYANKGLLGQAGAVLVMVLWVLALMTLVCGYYAVEARIRNNLGQQLWDEMAARQAVRSVLLLLSNRIAPADMDIEDALSQGLFIPDGRAYHLELGSMKIEFSIEDERGKLDLNKASEDQIRQVIQGLLGQTDPDEADAIADAILDWRDSDTLVRLKGAEEEAYEDNKPAYHPANGPFHIVDELLLVKGIDLATYYGPIEWLSSEQGIGNQEEGEETQWKGGLKDIFTVYSRSDKVLEAYAPEPLKELLTEGLSKSVAGIGVLKLRIKWGTRYYEIYFQPNQGEKGTRLLQWVEMPSIPEDEKG